MNKILCGLIVVIMLISSLSVSAASFTDVKQGDWYYETVTEMTEKGLFNGKGNNLFCPNDTMTKAEFLAVAMRVAFPEVSLKAENGLAWWQPAYHLAKQIQMIDEIIFPIDSMEDCITRQEMAYISSKAFFAQEDGNPDDTEYKNTVLLVTNLVLTAHIRQEGGIDLKNTIPDYDEIDNDYKVFAVIAYTTGLLGGVDETGRFAPKDTLTRAEGATVLHRLIRKDKRLKEYDSNDNQTETPDTQGAITIYEGQTRYNRNAQEGDLFIKKDGTQIVLKKGPNGVLGEGQGVAPDIGLLGQVTEEGCESFNYKVADYGSWTDGSGLRLQGNTYFINKTTGEGYWAGDLRTLRAKYPVPNRDGAYEGEVSSDPLHLYEWDCGDWYLNFNKG